MGGEEVRYKLPLGEQRRRQERGVVRPDPGEDQERVRRGSPSVFSTQRVKSQAACGKKQPSKRVWINDEAALDIGYQTEEFVRVTSTLQYLAGLKLFRNGYSIAGCFEVRRSNGDLRATRGAARDACIEYVDHVLDKAFPATGRHARPDERLHPREQPLW